MTIPTSFMLGGCKWQVKINNDIAKNNLLGECVHIKHTINLASKCENISLDHDKIVANFYHELTHAIIHPLEMTFDLSCEEDNEMITIFIADRLHQVLRTFSGTLKHD